MSWLLAAAVLTTTLRAWTRLQGYHAAALNNAVQSKAAPKLSKRVAVLVVEGLSTPDVQRMPSLRWLATTGGVWHVTLPDPWWAPASWATLLTGAEPQLHSRLFPQQQGALIADNIFAANRREGGSARIIADPAFASLVSTWAQPANLDELPKLVQVGGPTLVMAHLSANDDPSRRKLDRLLSDLLANMDLGQTSLVVVGMGQPYHHEGLMPVNPVLVAAGVTIVPGVSGTCTLADITALLADLAGTSRPGLASGRSLLVPPPPAKPTPPAEPLLAQVTTWYHGLPPGLSDRAKSAGAPVGFLLLMLLAVLWQPVRWHALAQPWRWLLVMPLIYWVMRGQWPWQMLGPIHGGFGTTWAWELILPMALASVWTLIWSGFRMGPARSSSFVRSSLTLGAWSTALFLCLAAGTLAWLYGVSFATSLPPTGVIWAYFALLWAAVAVLGVAPLALPLGMLSAGWAAQRFQQQQEEAIEAPAPRGHDNIIPLSQRRRPPS